MPSSRIGRRLGPSLESLGPACSIGSREVFFSGGKSQLSPVTLAKVRGLAEAIHGKVILYRWTLPNGEEWEGRLEEFASGGTWYELEESFPFKGGIAQCTSLFHHFE